MIRLYLEIHKLTDDLMDRLDNNEFGVTAAQGISFISQRGQRIINKVLDEDGSYKITTGNLTAIRELFDEKKAVVADDEKIKALRRIFEQEPLPKVKPSDINTVSIPFKADMYKRWFSDRTVEQAIELIIAALEIYHKTNEEENLNGNK